MDFRQLEYFINVAKTENMGVSAEQLHISQPALSMSIKRLEEELEVSLFDRRNHSIKLNSYGRLFLRYAQASIKDFEDGKKELLAAQIRKNKKVVVMCPLHYLMGSIVESFLSKYPDVSIEYTSVDYWTAEESLLDGTIDVHVTSLFPQSNLLKATFLTDRRVGILCRTDSDLAKKKTVKIEDLRDEKHLSFPETKQPRYDLDLMCSKRGFKPNVVFESDAMGSLITMCRRGIGVLETTDETTKHIDMTDLIFVPLDLSEPESKMNLYIVTRKEKNESVVDDLCDTIQDLIVPKEKKSGK